jgi:hypothetical protein
MLPLQAVEGWSGGRSFFMYIVCKYVCIKNAVCVWVCVSVCTHSSSLTSELLSIVLTSNLL